MISRCTLLLATICLSLLASAESIAAPGLLAQWNFDAGQGDIAHDSSGNGHDGKIFGAEWVKQGDGYALSLDGRDDYVDFGESRTIGIAGPVTLEAWIKPMRKAQGLAVILGESLSSYLLAYYNTEVCDLYIGAGSNSVRGGLKLFEWNHVVATFDGTSMAMWINGKLRGSSTSTLGNSPSSRLIMGTKGQPSLPRFKGIVDRVRVYNRAFSAEEVAAHFKGEAAEYGVDLTWFSRVKVTPYYYLDRKEVVAEADYTGLQPLTGAGRLTVTLHNKERPNEIIEQQVIKSVSGIGVTDVKLSLSQITAGNYGIRVRLEDSQNAYPIEELSFSYPAKPLVVSSPANKTVGPLPPTSGPTPFKFTMGRGGGFALTINGANYPFASRISWPNGGFNRLTVDKDTPHTGSEASWSVRTSSLSPARHNIEAKGHFYTIHRQIEVFPTHVSVKDTYTNTTAGDLGLLIYNEIPVSPGQLTQSLLSGYERWGRQVVLTYPDYGPSLFVTDAHAGIGMLPIDDVYVVQAVPYAEWENAAGVGTEKFALAPGKSYTLEWAVYPTGSRDYYDFINTFRKVAGRIGTVDKTPGFITYGPHVPLRRAVPDRNFIEHRGLKVGIIHSLSEIADDPDLHVDGIDFMDFPKEMQLLKEQAAAIHAAHPGLQVVLHIAHSLYATNNPDRFADSKVLGPDGKQLTWGDGSAFGPVKQAAGWRWWIFYPTPTNSFHNALMRGADVLMDEIGMDGGFMDGFLAGYQGHWNYDGRWDGHSAEVNLITKTITRKVGSVLLLSQPSMIEFARKIRDKGGVVVVNNSVYTRSITNEKYIIFDHEAASGPEMHLAPTVTALAKTTDMHTEKGVYHDMLDKLSWGELWISYGEAFNVFANRTHYTLASKQFPITFEEIRPGLVKGKERIVTMHSGTYGWPGSRDLHLVYKFDGRGGPVPHAFVTTVDRGGVRTEIIFDKYESAVLEPIPVSLKASTPVNGLVTQYDRSALRVILNGRGETVLQVRSGTFPIVAGIKYHVSVNGSAVHESTANPDGTLSLPLSLKGQVEVAVAQGVLAE